MATTTAARPDETVRTRVRLFAWLLVGMVVMLTQPLPFRLAAIGFGVVALWAAGTALGAMRRVRREGGRPRGAWALAAGAGLVAVLVLGQAAQAAIYPVTANLERCLVAANTRAAEAKCQQEAEQRVERWREQLERMQRAGG